uniref:C-type lectin domain-containing protein n=1 Tax=Tetradesmus obliquus TaxID=3088 RepID=A0A383VLJ3_TETOB|eukprot:jgi/Sobl393_1/9452/SZX66051.1
MLSQDPSTSSLVALVLAKLSPRAWSDWSAPDYPGMLMWSPQCEGRVLNVTRDTDSARNITTFPSPRYYGRPYVCAFNYTPSEVASSSHAVMHGDRTFTLFTAQADFEAAASICASHGLQLASAHAADDNAALAGLAAQDRKWSGGHLGGSMLLGLRYNDSSYTWQDGTEVDWAPDGFDLTQPPPPAPVTGYSRLCVVVLADGTWTPISCTRQPASFACQRTPEGWSYQAVAWDNAYESQCSTETYITASALGQPVKILLQTYTPANGSTYANIRVVMDPQNDLALQAMGYSYWSTAMIPLHPVARLPSYTYTFPAPGDAGSSADHCAVTAVFRPAFGTTALLYARIAQVHAGTFLEILGRVRLASGVAQPVRGAVKFLSKVTGSV